jgi:hypothetical protein
VKIGDLVKYNKPMSRIWDSPHDIPNGSIGILVEELRDDRFNIPHTDFGVMIDGRIRLIPKSFLKVIDETG